MSGTNGVNLAGWSDLFVACAGAGSALAGLIIVAMSVNIAKILAIPSMTSRAATTVAGLVLIVVVSCTGLVPGQPAQALGVEVALASAIALLLAVRSAGEIVRLRPPAVGLGLAALKAALGLVPAGGTLAGGLLLVADLTAGLYVLAAAMIAGFGTAVTNAWVLLVEILR